MLGVLWRGSTRGHGRERLYRVVDAAYEKRSIALSSNLHPAKAHRFYELMPKTIANAATVEALSGFAQTAMRLADDAGLVDEAALAVHHTGPGWYGVVDELAEACGLVRSIWRQRRSASATAKVEGLTSVRIPRRSQNARRALVGRADDCLSTGTRSLASRRPLAEENRRSSSGVRLHVTPGLRGPRDVGQMPLVRSRNNHRLSPTEVISSGVASLRLTSGGWPSPSLYQRDLGVCQWRVCCPVQDEVPQETTRYLCRRI